MKLTQSGSSACAQFCYLYHKYGHEVGNRLPSSSVSYVKLVPKTVTFFLSLMLFNRSSTVPCLTKGAYFTQPAVLREARVGGVSTLQWAHLGVVSEPVGLFQM